MVAGLKEIDPVVADKVDDSVFLCQPPRPGPGDEVSQRLRLPYPPKRIANDGFD